MTELETSDPAGPARLGRSVDADGTAERHDRILVPVGEFDEERVERLATEAAELAGMMQASVHVLHVFDPDRFDRIAEATDAEDAADGGPDPDELVGEVEAVRTLVRELDEPLRDWGMRMTVGARVGERVSAEVVAAAEAIDAKRILVCGRRRTPTGKAVFGSTAQEVLLNAHCPVTFVQDV